MRGLAACAVVIAAVLIGGSAAHAAEPDWVCSAGGGPLYPRTTEGPFLGRSFSVSVAKPLRPWFLLGPEATWYRIDARGGPGWYGFTWTDAWDAVAVTVTSRLQIPTRVGPAPFVTAGSGLSWATGGASYYAGIGNPYVSRYPGRNETVWVTSVGLGVRVVAPGAWPDVELGVRKVAWIGTEVRSLIEPHLTLAF